MARSNIKSIMITGTDTGAGKTFLTALLAQYFLEEGKSACVFKPVQTGSPSPSQPEDPIWIQKFLNCDIPWHVTYCFAPPVAPTMADTDNVISFDKIITDFNKLQNHYDIVLVEGAGGLRVPVTQTQDMRDLAQALNSPVLLASRPNLGTINHTLLSLEALTNKKIDCMGVIVSGFNPDTTDPAETGLEAEFNRLMPEHFLGMVPFYSSPTLEVSAKTLLPEKVLPLLKG